MARNDPLLEKLPKGISLSEIPKLLDDKEFMAKADFDTLAALRNMFPYQEDKLAKISPYEHRAWIREMGTEGPMGGAKAAVLGAGAIPAGYQVFKGLTPTDWRDAYQSPVGIDQMWQAFLGAIEANMR